MTGGRVARIVGDEGEIEVGALRHGGSCTDARHPQVCLVHDWRGDVEGTGSYVLALHDALPIFLPVILLDVEGMLADTQVRGADEIGQCGLATRRQRGDV